MALQKHSINLKETVWKKLSNWIRQRFCDLTHSLEIDQIEYSDGELAAVLNTLYREKKIGFRDVTIVKTDSGSKVLALETIFIPNTNEEKRPR